MIERILSKSFERKLEGFPVPIGLIGKTSINFVKSPVFKSRLKGWRKPYLVGASGCLGAELRNVAGMCFPSVSRQASNVSRLFKKSRHCRLRYIHGKLLRGFSCQLCRSKDVVDYLIYMAEDREGTNRSLLGSSA